ncbi:hypothetical protein [Nocardia jinanensis]|uniref:Uncharacterized protein n=1 Tax=Nocardia jinanensis TaxID=382504 RepID=A0A917VX06_9NOCA|nr:hypothetical protein [Nocardia jinanensis]GGL25004.1 hypothetical protein GCM10011588_44810 [Nocardia jinanensis]
MSADPRTLTPSERAWIDTRSYVREHRSDLDAAAARAYPALHRVADSTLLAHEEWIPSAPIHLEDVVSALEVTPVSKAVGSAPPASPALPVRGTGDLYTNYAEAVGELVAPTVFENRPTFRLVHADLTAETPSMRFGLGSYFDSINIGEAAAHEFAMALQGHGELSGVRAAITDPCDPAQRPVNLAISTVTIRRDPGTGAESFLLHWRDPRKVGHAGGMYQVVPVGIFQPSGNAEWNIGNDFSLWHNMVREFAEELGGADEDHGSEIAPIDYENWEFAARFDQARRDGSVVAYCLGLGVDPLSFATDLLTAVVIDGPVFDSLFGNALSSNAEGHILEWQPFTPEHVQSVVTEHPVQAAGIAALRRAISLLG